MSIGFLGAGNMATAIIKGYVKKADTDILVYDIDKEQTKKLTALGVKAIDSAKELVSQSDYLILAVKPQVIPQVLQSVKDCVKKETVIVSIAAGISGEYIKTTLGFDAKVILVMPNTPLLLGCGATALSRLAPTQDKEFTFICEMFRSSGEIAVIEPDKMCEIIPINGSSPAFIYEYAKHFISYGVSQGFDEDVVKTLFAQTLIGSAKMMAESGYSIDELITMVSSKGGTTIAGLEGLRQGELEQTVEDACKRCVNRAYELAK